MIEDWVGLDTQRVTEAPPLPVPVPGDTTSKTAERSSPMISVWWLLIGFVGGGCAGILLMALMRNPECASGSCCLTIDEPKMDRQVYFSGGAKEVLL
jgi:hypothetical protein